MECEPKLHGRLSDTRYFFTVDIQSFLEAVGAENLLVAQSNGKVFNINGGRYKVINFTFGSDEPLELECQAVKD